MTPLSTENVSVGKPAMFQARILMGSPNILLNVKSFEQGIFILWIKDNNNFRKSTKQAWYFHPDTDIETDWYQKY